MVFGEIWGVETPFISSTEPLSNSAYTLNLRPSASGVLVHKASALFAALFAGGVLARRPDITQIGTDR